MKVTIQRNTLLKPLQMISGVIERCQTMPILANVLLTAEKDLSIAATDLQMEVIGTVALEKEAEPGSITVSFTKLRDICRALPEEALLHLNLEGDHVVLRSERSRFLLATLPARDFPKFEESPFTTEFTISQSKFKKLLSKTYFAMAQQDVRHYLNGTLFDINNGVVKCVATDGHRLAFTVINDPDLGAANLKVILPRKSVLELIRLLDANNEEAIKVSMGENHFRIVSSEFVFTSKLINAQYPDYESLIPRHVTHTVMTSREALKQALARASILSNEKFRGIRCQLDGDTLRIVANNPEQEEAEELVNLHNYQGSSMEIGFNAAYLIDVVSNITSPDIRCSFTDANGGVLFEATEKDDSLYVVMPMRL
jgi:DNA polymerase III subunit beta